MYIYVYICIYIHICIHVHIFMYTYTHTHLCIYYRYAPALAEAALEEQLLERKLSKQLASLAPTDEQAHAALRYAGFRQVLCVLNPTPQTLNPKPQTLNPKP